MKFLKLSIIAATLLQLSVANAVLITNGDYDQATLQVSVHYPDGGVNGNQCPPGFTQNGNMIMQWDNVAYGTTVESEFVPDYAYLCVRYYYSPAAYNTVTVKNVPTCNIESYALNAGGEHRATPECEYKNSCPAVNGERSTYSETLDQCLPKVGPLRTVPSDY